MIPNNTTVTSAEEFQRRLNDLVADARQNDVPVEGGWACGSTDADQFEAHITRVVPPTE